MCNFLSALVVQNGDVLMHPMLDSHADLVRYFQLPDQDAHVRHFVKVELIPEDWMDPNTWTWQVDEDPQALPLWWPDVAESSERGLRARARQMILREGAHDLVIDGAWIVGGTAQLTDVRAWTHSLRAGLGADPRRAGLGAIHGVWLAQIARREGLGADPRRAGSAQSTAWGARRCSRRRSRLGCKGDVMISARFGAAVLGPGSSSRCPGTRRRSEAAQRGAGAVTCAN